jgi:GNAT superfamily N-acetyltransferase
VRNEIPIPSPKRQDRLPDISVRRLGPALAGDYLALFDSAFSDNAEWSGCYCLYYHSDEEPWSGPEAAARHRAERAAQLARDDVPGYLAYVDARPVGWLNAGPAEAYANLRGLPPCSPGEALIMCFVVAPHARWQGVAGALLDFALADLARRGCRAAVAFPPRGEKPGELSWEAANFKGPRALYLARGFTLEERDGRMAARRIL